MRPSSHIRRPAASDLARKRRPWRRVVTHEKTAWAAPQTVLGADHPLTRAVAALQTVRRQSVVVAAILFLAVIGWIPG